jgi:NAD-reducing hydrogenase large subunit
VAGGVNKALKPAERDAILADVDASIETIQLGLSIMKDWAAQNQEDINKFAVFSSGYFGLVTPEGSLELYDGDCRLIDRGGNRLEEFNGRDYLDYIAEHVEDWSYLKFPYYKEMGWPDGVYRVGPLGRLNVAERIDTPLADEELKAFKALNGGKPIENTLYFHYARLIETLFAAERVKVLLDDPDILSTDILNTHREYTGEGVGVIEAPRGTLFHHYKANPNGQIERVNLIVATGHNNWAMSKSVDSVAKTYIVAGKEITEGLLNRVEAAIRAHDPCLSCSTHALGQMPIVVDIVDAQGAVVNTLKRNGR